MPDNPFEEEQRSRNPFSAEANRRAAAGAFPSTPTEEAAAQDREIRQGLRTMGGGLVANVLSAPHAVGELMGMSPVQPFPMVSEVLRKMPDPDAQDILALAGTPLAAFTNLGEQIDAYRQGGKAPHPGSALLEGYRSSRREEQELADSKPLSTSAGQAAADAATIVGVRRLSSGLLNNVSREGGETASWLNKAASALYRGSKRTAEAGFEGALVAALGDGDPANTAAWSAGVQAGGSMALAARGTIIRHPFQSLGTIWLGHEIFKALAPGPQNLLESKDEAIQEMIAAYGLGVAAALAGAGRSSNSVIDSISAASRGSIASVISQLQTAREEDKPQYERVIAKVIEDPDYFGPEVTRLLERAANSESANALTRQIDSLMESARFRKLYDELQ